MYTYTVLIYLYFPRKTAEQHGRTTNYHTSKKHNKRKQTRIISICLLKNSNPVQSLTQFDIHLSEEKPLQNTEPPQITTTSINRTNETLIKNTTPTIQLVHARTGAENVTSTTTLHTKEKVTSRPTQRHVGESDKTSTSPHAGMAQSGGTHITALSVSLALVVCLSAVSVVAAVFFVRWKK